MRNRLLRYELKLFLRSFADAFGRTRDRILLAAVLAILVLSAPQWLDGAALPSWLLPAAAAFLSYNWQRAVRARLRWLAQESVFAADALEKRARLGYLASAHALLLIPLLAVALATAEPATAILAALCYLAGSAAASVPRPHKHANEARERERPMGFGDGRVAVLRAVLSRQTLGTSRPGTAALGLLGAVFLLTFALALAFGGDPAPIHSAAIAAPALLALLLLATRLDGAVLGFLPYAGYGPGFAALAVAALPVGCFAAAAAAMWIAASDMPLLLLLLLHVAHLAVATTSIFRAWLYPGRLARSVDFQVQVELAGLALIGWLLPPLALAAAAWRAATLCRRHRALRWVHP